jgi:hypothetical protein
LQHDQNLYPSWNTGTPEWNWQTGHDSRSMYFCKTNQNKNYLKYKQQLTKFQAKILPKSIRSCYIPYLDPPPGPSLSLNNDVSMSMKLTPNPPKGQRN